MSKQMNYLRFWGVRGSYPAPFGSHLRVGGNTSCVELCVDGYVLACDGGTGIIPLGSDLFTRGNVNEIAIILTHYHWDHISGLPFFGPAFVPGWTVNFFGPGNSPQEIQERISGQMRTPYFPVEVEEWKANINYMSLVDNKLTYGPFTIEYFNVHHPGVTLGYRITVHDKVIIYVSDNELMFIDQSIEDRKDELEPKELEIMEAMRKEEWDNAVKHVENADILIHDSQYTEEDYAKKRGFGHSRYLDALEFARDANVKSFYMFHVDPNYDDTKIESLHRHALSVLHETDSDMGCHIAHEGLSIDIDTL